VPLSGSNDRGVARILHWGATEAERLRRENRGAESTEVGKNWGGGVFGIFEATEHFW